MTIEKRESIIELYDMYGSLLTEKQKRYFEDYYFADLSISEIADNYQISRNAVFDQLKRGIQNLEEYEAKLHNIAHCSTIINLEIPIDIKEKILAILRGEEDGI